MGVQQGGRERHILREARRHGRARAPTLQRPRDGRSLPGHIPGRSPQPLVSAPRGAGHGVGGARGCRRLRLWPCSGAPCGSAWGTGLDVAPRCPCEGEAAPQSLGGGRRSQGHLSTPAAAHTAPACPEQLTGPQPTPGAASISLAQGWEEEPQGKATDTPTFVEQRQRQGGEIVELEERRGVRGLRRGAWSCECQPPPLPPFKQASAWE